MIIQHASRSLSVVTKQLCFNVVDDKRKVRLSSNFLGFMNFQRDMPISVRPLGVGAGFQVEPAANDQSGTHKVYSRKYKKGGRSNNPFELVVEFGGQSLINHCFPAYTERFHVEMRPGLIKFSPMANRVFGIINRFKQASPYQAFVALTGGVDVHAMEALGWKAQVILEHRPSEARDRASGRNLSEVHALNVLVNGNPKIILNEDIHQIDIGRLQQLLSEVPPIGMCHYSLGCDDHSNAKSGKAKARALDDLSTMVDMVYPALKQIELIQPMVVLVENVRGFRDSAAGVMMATSLKRFGYKVTEMVLNGLDYGAFQARERYYLVASVFPGYQSPSPVVGCREDLWSLIESHLPVCSEVTETNLIKSREGYWRNLPPYLTKQSVSCPTVMKSQDRVRDAVFIEEAGRVFKPSIDLLKGLMSIPEAFNVSWMAKEQATETLGQSVDYKLHQAVIGSINEHLSLNVGKHSVVNYGLK